MNSTDLVRRFHSALPLVRGWIDKILKENAGHAVPVADVDLPRIRRIFPADLLKKTKVVTGSVPFPPLSLMGLHELSEMETMRMSGVTYKDTFFLKDSQQTESLYFHEMVHAVQWERLGVNNFLLAYGIGLMQFGYRESPFEQMAYSLQTAFDQGQLGPGVVGLIQRGTDAVWSSVRSIVS